jgi:hypothetical protein
MIVVSVQEAKTGTTRSRARAILIKRRFLHIAYGILRAKACASPRSWVYPSNGCLRCFSRKGSMASQRHPATQRHSRKTHNVIPAKETVSYRFITFELARRLSTRCPRASWLIAKSNHRQARRSLQDAYVDQRRLCVIPSLWLPIPFLRWLEWRL